MHPPEAEALLTEQLRQQFGLRPDTVLRQQVQQALDDLLRASGRNLEALVAQLQAAQAPWQDFLDRVLVPESWFRREAGALSALAAEFGSRTAAPQPLRVLCAPCSAGEEPISIALLLRDLGWPDEALHIDGVDLSRTAIAAAERGVYRKHSFRGVGQDWLKRHFEIVADGPNRRLRQPLAAASLQFSRADLFALPRTAIGYDVVFCRNLLIYLEPAARQRLLQQLRLLCREDGLLFVGHAEAPLLQDAGLEALRERMSFGFRNRPRRAAAAPLGACRAWGASAANRPQRSISHRLFAP